MRRKHQKQLLIIEEPEEQFEPIANPFHNKWVKVATIAETITALARKHASPALARQIVEQCKFRSILFTPVDEAVITTAIGFYNPDGSKKNTFFDAIVAAAAKLAKADAIFSFDNWYKKQGFKITDDILAEH